MTDITYTYDGPLQRGRVPLPTRSVAFVKGEPVAFTAHEAELLAADWTKVKKASKAAKAAPDTEAPASDTQED